MRRARTTLSTDDNSLLDLHFEQGLTVRQIATELGMSKTTAHANIARIVATLRSTVAA